MPIMSAKKGGEGAVREVCEKILKAKGLWDGIVEGYLVKGMVTDSNALCDSQRDEHLRFLASL